MSTIYEFELWKQEHKDSLLAFGIDALDRILKLGMTIGMTRREIERLRKIRTVFYDEGRWYDIDRARFTVFNPEKADHWRGDIELTVRVESWIPGEDVPDPGIAGVAVESTRSSKLPTVHDVPRFGKAIMEVGYLAIDLEMKLTAVLMAIGDDAVDPLLRAAYDAESDRRLFLQRAHWERPVTREWFNANLLHIWFDQYRATGECDPLYRRIKGADRKKLNEVSDAVITVEHHRGAESVIRPTPSLVAHIGQVVADQAKRAAEASEEDAA